MPTCVHTAVGVKHVERVQLVNCLAWELWQVEFLCMLVVIQQRGLQSIKTFVLEVGIVGVM